MDYSRQVENWLILDIVQLFLHYDDFLLYLCSHTCYYSHPVGSSHPRPWTEFLSMLTR